MPTREETAELFAIHRSREAQAERMTRSVGFDDTRTWVDPNGYRLSDRVWQQSQSVRTNIDDFVVHAIGTGQDAIVAAKNVERYLNPALAPTRTVKGRIVRDDRKGVLTTRPRGGTGSYPARRLMRTEITRAHGQAAEKLATKFPSLIWWRLSPSHPEIDICDTYSRRDTGNGAGRYKPGKSPRYPAHPHCLCRLEIVPTESDAEMIARLRKDFGLEELEKELGIPGPRPPAKPIPKPRAPRKPKVDIEEQARRAERKRLAEDRFGGYASAAEQQAAKDALARAAEAARKPPPKPVSDFINWNRTGRSIDDVHAVDRALEAVNKVHRVEMPKLAGNQTINLRLGGESKNSLGTYFHGGRSTLPRIAIKEGGKKVASTTAHEIGHFIDQQALGMGRGFATDPIVGGVARRQMDELMRALSESDSVSKLREIERTGHLLGANSSVAAPMEWVTYAAEDIEIFARAYAQWIAKKSGNKTMIREIDNLARYDGGLPQQWTDDDFRPISEAFDNLFREAGWLIE